jgi:hypothetical protein
VVYWDADERKDLLVGVADGRIKLFLNTNTDDQPEFDGGDFLEVGEPGLKVDINVGARTCSVVADWNSDGRKDLVVGEREGKIHVFLNEGTDTEPDFRSELLAQANGADLVVPSARSSPDVLDLDDDGRKDLLTGNTNGELVFYSNTGSEQAPSFSDYVYVEADGVPIDLPGTPRSRPFVCDWNDDGERDVLIGAGDGYVRLYLGQCAADLTGDGQVTQSDLGVLLADWGCNDPANGCPGDLDGDDDTDQSDLGILLADWGCGQTVP